MTGCFMGFQDGKAIWLYQTQKELNIAENCVINLDNKVISITSLQVGDRLVIEGNPITKITASRPTWDAMPDIPSI